MEYRATMKQICSIRCFGGLLHADSCHMCFGLIFPYNTLVTGPHVRFGPPGIQMDPFRMRTHCRVQYIATFYSLVIVIFEYILGVSES